MGGTIRSESSVVNNELPRRAFDDNTWVRLARLVDLPNRARTELNCLVLVERHKLHERRICSQSGAETRDLLRKLYDTAVSLATAVTSLGPSARSAILSALLDEDQYKGSPLQLPDRLNSELAELEDTLRKWQDRLARARSVTSEWKAPSRRKTRLREVVVQLDALLDRYTGKRLVRSSMHSKGRGRAGVCFAFVREIVDMIFGSRISSNTIDSAIRDAITHRRSVG